MCRQVALDCVIRVDVHNACLDMRGVGGAVIRAGIDQLMLRMLGDTDTRSKIRTSALVESVRSAPAPVSAGSTGQCRAWHCA